MSPPPVFFFRIALAILGPLQLLTNDELESACHFLQRNQQGFSDRDCAGL